MGLGLAPTVFVRTNAMLTFSGIFKFSAKNITQRYKSPRGSAIFPLGAIFACGKRYSLWERYLPVASDMPCGALWDLYHIALERSDNISHEQSEYIAFACKHIA